MTTVPAVRLTERLRLEPIGPEHAADLFRLFRDPAVAEWYGEWTRGGVEREVARIADHVVSFTEVHNRRSRTVMERLGFRHDKDFAVGGEPFALYVLDRDDGSRAG